MGFPAFVFRLRKQSPFFFKSLNKVSTGANLFQSCPKLFKSLRKCSLRIIQQSVSLMVI